MKRCGPSHQSVIHSCHLSIVTESFMGGGGVIRYDLGHLCEISGIVLPTKRNKSDYKMQYIIGVFHTLIFHAVIKTTYRNGLQGHKKQNQQTSIP